MDEVVHNHPTIRTSSQTEAVTDHTQKTPTNNQIQSKKSDIGPQ